jgi:hypothetical protein
MMQKNILLLVLTIFYTNIFRAKDYNLIGDNFPIDQIEVVNRSSITTNQGIFISFTAQVGDQRLVCSKYTYEEAYLCFVIDSSGHTLPVSQEFQEIYSQFLEAKWDESQLDNLGDNFPINQIDLDTVTRSSELIDQQQFISFTARVGEECLICSKHPDKEEYWSHVVVGDGILKVSEKLHAPWYQFLENMWIVKDYIARS